MFSRRLYGSVGARRRRDVEHDRVDCTSRYVLSVLSSDERLRQRTGVRRRQVRLGQWRRPLAPAAVAMHRSAVRVFVFCLII